MALARRVGLFLLTNLAVMLVLGVIYAVLDRLGILPKEGFGSDWVPLLLFSLVWGMGGAFLSLALSKSLAKMAVGAQVIRQPRNEVEHWLLTTVARQAQAAGIGMPEVAVYDAPDMNAFATGACKDAALVAVSTGLLRNMGRPEVEAVLAHEVSHVANGDMVTMALLQGVLNAFVIFFSRALARLADAALQRGDDRRGPSGLYYVFVFLFDMLFGVLATVIAMWFSRMREYRADAGAARLVGAGPMIGALEALKQSRPAAMPPQVKAFGILGDVRSLFSSHPPLEARIAALRQM
ncbi:MAG: protease HtpX [Sandaracinus sp.]|nr:protease HtpX [Sandaracinus sp.]MCB9619212.1 protease HtpX [Sandaracinus sp.]MCB9631469.1 protease HtpX [Sandaracinus sp.]